MIREVADIRSIRCEALMFSISEPFCDMLDSRPEKMPYQLMSQFVLDVVR